MKHEAGYKPSRRHFLRNAGRLFALYPFWEACRNAVQMAVARMAGAPYTLGHRLLTRDFPPVETTKHVKTLIIGGGVTGLSAARQLAKRGETDFLVLELDTQPGGNSTAGENEWTKFPLGAHYLPLPNLHDKPLLDFLQESGIIIGFDEKNNPIFDETQLATAPQERLYIHDHWQEGLVPNYGLAAEEKTQIGAFFQQMEDFKRLKGHDGRFVFDIPLKHCSTDAQWRALDKLTFEAWLSEHGFDSPTLLEHLNYCCLDDFGAGISRVSAWAGIHYFAARKHPDDNVLTWSEGNARLVQHLARWAEGRLLPQHLAYQIALEKSGGVAVSVYDAAQDKSLLIRAQKVIVATPQFVAQRLVPERRIDLSAFHYAPWMTATLVLRYFPQSPGAPLSWDNVIFKGKGLGYIHTRHQELTRAQNKCVLTYYHAFDTDNVPATRRMLYQKTPEAWRQYILDDLRTAHPDIDQLTESVTVQVWGHGMITPLPGFIWGRAVAAARQSWGGRVVFAHTDLVGISLFEEAFHAGIDAV
jgi:phytoene dehydrogenase-like protein